jgi:hypothetical protein
MTLQSVARPIASLALLALLVVGCAPAGPTSIGLPAASARSTADDMMPLRYVIEIKNSLAIPLTFTLTPGSGASLDGPSSFEVPPDTTKIAKVNTAAFAPGEIVTIEGAGADRSKTLHDIVSIVDSAVAFRMHGLTGMDEKAAILRNKENTEVTVSMDATPAVTAQRTHKTSRHPSEGTEYSVTLTNDLPSDPLDVTVKTSEDSRLQGPPSFVLASDASEAVRVTDTGSSSASDRIAAVDAAEHVNAQVELLKKQGGEFISISDMFIMQMNMNRLSQLSEIGTAVVSGTNSAIVNMARDTKE